MNKYQLEDLKVLSVEDSLTQSEQIKYTLEILGVQSFHCYNGKEALKLLKTLEPDLIISDIVMPDMDGFELCRQVKNNAGLKHIPFIFLSTLDSAGDILKAIESKADSYIMKPLNRQVLQSRISQVLANKEKDSEEEPDSFTFKYNDVEYIIDSDGKQILNMLFSSFESVKQKSMELKSKKEELIDANEHLRIRIEDRKADLRKQLDMIRNTDNMLKSTERSYRLLVENALVAIMTTNLKGEVVQFNDACARLMKLAPDEFIKITVRELWANEENWDDFLSKLNRNRSIVAYETQFKYGASGPGYVLINAFIEGNEISYMILDINEQKLEEDKMKAIMDELITAKEKAAKSESVKTSFLANMSDKIIRPMDDIVNMVDNIQLIEDAEKMYFTSVNVSKRGNYLMNLIDNTIDIAMIDSGDTKIRLEECQINQILIDLLAEYQKRIQQEKPLIELRLRKDVKDQDFLMVTQPYRLKRILMNLISSAVDYTTEGIIEFGYRTYLADHMKQGVFQFYVKDTGKGMPEGRVKHIFDRFSIDIPVDKSEHPGSGFGLPHSKGYVELLGGGLWCKSQPEKGTEFHFTHPFHGINTDSVDKFDKYIATSFKKATMGKKLLVSDEHDDNYYILSKILEPLKMNITRVRNGNELIDILKNSRKFDILLLDLVSYIVSGIELIKEVRHLNNKVPVIIQSMHFTSEEKVVLKEFGCNDLLVKPLNPEILYCMIATHV